MKIREVFLNDKYELQNLIKRNIDNQFLCSNDIESDINTLVAQNITHKTPNKSYCIIEDEKLIGFVYFYNHDEKNNSIYMGYLLDRKYHGKGIMTITASNIISELFSNSEITNILLIVDLTNYKSINLINKLNFRCIGEEYDNGNTYRIYSFQKTDH